MAKAKPASADRQIVAAGKTWTLRFSVRAMAALQDHYGLASITETGQLLQSLGDRVSIDDLTAILWAGLRTHHPEATKDDALGLLDDLGIEGMMAIFAGAFDAAAPPAVQGEEAGGNAAAGPPVP